MTLDDFTQACNGLLAAEAARLNAEYQEGKAIFGAEHHDLPPEFYRPYYEEGLTPEQAVRRMDEEAGI